MRPLLVVEGRPRAASRRVASAVAAARAEGWTIVRGWSAPLRGDRLLCTGPIRTTDDARRALLAVLAGAGLVVSAAAERETVDRLVDDLRRLGPVEHVVLARPGRRAVAPQARALLGLLAEGLSPAEAAARLGIERRTADRQLAAARSALGVETLTTAAITAMLRAER